MERQAGTETARQTETQSDRKRFRPTAERERDRQMIDRQTNKKRGNQGARQDDRHIKH